MQLYWSQQPTAGRLIPERSIVCISHVKNPDFEYDHACTILDATPFESTASANGLQKKAAEEKVVRVLGGVADNAGNLAVGAPACIYAACMAL